MSGHAQRAILGCSHCCIAMSSGADAVGSAVDGGSDVVVNSVAAVGSMAVGGLSYGSAGCNIIHIRINRTSQKKRHGDYACKD